MSRGKELITQMVAGLGSNIAAGPCAEACTSLLAAAGAGGIIAALGPVGVAIVPLTLFGGATFLQICRQKKVEAREEAHLRRLQKALSRLATHQDEARQELADLALEQEWLREAIENGPAAVSGALAAMKADLDIALGALAVKVDDIAQTLEGLVKLEFDTNWRVRGLDEKADRIIETQAQHGGLISQAVDDIAEVKALLLAQGKSREQIEAELRPRLEQEIEAKLRAERQSSDSTEDPATVARRLADTAITALREKDFAQRAAEVGGGLAVLESLERTATAHEKAADHHIEAAKENWRKTAEWAFLVGEIDKADAALRRIIAFDPDDIDAINRLGHIKQLRGELDEAARLYARVGELAPDDSWRAKSLGNLGLIEWTRGNLDAAEAYLKQSLAINEKLGRPEGMAAAYGNLGLIEQTRGNLDAAEAYLKKSLELNEKVGKLEGMANQLGNLGLIERKRGHLDAAEAYHKKSLAINEKLGRPEGMAAQFGNLGLIERMRGNLDAAEAYLKKSLAINEKLGSQEGMATAYGNLGLIEQTRGNLDAAEAHLKKSLAINEKLGRPEGMAIQYGNLGLIEQTRGNLDAAEAYHKKALAIDEKLGSQEGMAADYGNLGLVEGTRGNLDAAETYNRQSLAINEKLARLEGIAAAYHNLGVVESMRGNMKEACRLWTRARDLFSKIGAKDRERQAQAMLDEAGCGGS